ncbi:hypothetical protein C8J57DRAFT_1438946 [Mycena rebaudengoi]|nr:hypothetical protein C8J57DRAFT_1438946 [Mycena rebaudengoi]
MLATSFLWLLLASMAYAEVTVYGQIPMGITSATNPTATKPAAYNTTVLNPPPVPNPPIGTNFTLVLQASNASVYPLSIPLKGSFYGFSIEMSVISQLSDSHISPIFLNLMSNIVARAGAVHVRTGDNTQEYAFFVDELPFHAAIGKQKANTNNPTETPAWYMGVPFNVTTPFRLDIVHHGQEIMGDNLLALQAGNEPDLYADFGEFGDLGLGENALIRPSLATGDWTPEMMRDTGFIDAYKDSLYALAMEHYPDDNCFASFGIGQPKDYQKEFEVFLNHTAGERLVAPYLNSSAIALAAGKPFLMFETNSASCGGFPGISDSFGGALWALDYGLQMAYSNFSGALLHAGGQNVFYNPFTAPPINESAYYDWTIGATYYAALIVSEVLGSTNTSQLLDLHGNEANIYTPQYAVYENGNIAKVALFNYVTDPSGNSDYVATITYQGGTVPSSVKVKYFLSDSVSTKDNITWGGQTFGTSHNVDGRLKGAPDVRAISCDTTANTCLIPVPAPGFALVFLADSAFTDVGEVAPMTYSTTAYTKTHNTARVDPTVLANSNGNSGRLWDQHLGSTSQGSRDSGARGTIGDGAVVAVLLSVLGGAVLVAELLR